MGVKQGTDLGSASSYLPVNTSISEGLMHRPGLSQGKTVRAIVSRRAYLML